VDFPSPAYVIDLSIVRRNCEILGRIKSESGCRIVHALKAFALPQAFPILRQYLDGCCASGLWEAQLAHQFFGPTILTCGPAYRDADQDLFELSSHLDFNSLNHWGHWRDYALAHPRYLSGALRFGLRINPQCSTGATRLYDPCSSGSRLGVPPDHLPQSDLTGVSGFHFHTLCEQGSDALAVTLEAVDRHFGSLLRSEQFRWINLGGGHWITNENYDRDLLVRLIAQCRKRYQLDEIWLEPGEAAVFQAGALHARVLDLFRNGDTHVAILDVSATAHMPDVLEMPYRPKVTLDLQTAGKEGPHRYRLGGITCLAGDVIGDYAFHRPLAIGDELVFHDMAHYTMVKTTCFNGVQHPAIVLRDESGGCSIVREFDYQDFISRLT